MHAILWNSIISHIQHSIDAHNFETWFKPLTVCAGDDPAVLRINAPSKFIADFVDQHYKKTILSTAKQFSPQICSVVFEIKENIDNSIVGTDAFSDSLTQNLNIQQKNSQDRSYPQLNKRFTLKTFVEGSNNKFARSAATAVAELAAGIAKSTKTKHFNPLLIYGGVGLGKTHLLQSIGNYVIENNQQSVVTYITSEEFYLNFIDAIKNNSTQKFTARFRASDVLLMDDIQFFAGKESTQEEFFHIFNTLHQNRKQIVLTSDLPPASLKGLQDRLVSRFQWGLSVDIQPPDLETRVAILKKKFADENDLSLAPEILNYIAENISSNIRELEGVVIRLLAFASIVRRDITLDLVKDLLKDAAKTEKTKISIDDIIEKVATFYKVPVNNIREKNRRKEVAFCRQVAMYVSKTITNNSLKTIGLNFGGRDHSTVIHAIQQIEELIKKDANTAKDIDYIISLLK